MEQNLPESDDTVKLYIDGELEEFIQSQTMFDNGFCKVYIGGWRFERKYDDPEHVYRFASDEIMTKVKDHFKSELADRFKDMKSFWFVNYNNGHERTYTMFDIDKDFADYDWREFMKNVPYNRFFGSGPGDFQQALQEHGIAFRVGMSKNQEQLDKYNEVEWNKENIKLIEHSNIGNY